MSKRTRSRLTRAAAGPVAALFVFAACSGEPTSSDKASDQVVSEPTPTGPTLPHDADSPTPAQLTEGHLAAATYQLSFLVSSGVDAPRMAVDVPNGFDGAPPWYVVSSDGFQFLGLWTVGQVDRDACPSGANHLFDPGPSVEDLADALVAQESTRASAPKPVTLAGYRGLYVELKSPDDISGCKRTGHLWGDPGGRCICSKGQTDQLWILDVDGQRLVVNAAYSRPESTESDIDRLAAMVDSLEFVPPATE